MWGVPLARGAEVVLDGGDDEEDDLDAIGCDDDGEGRSGQHKHVIADIEAEGQGGFEDTC